MVVCIGEVKKPKNKYVVELVFKTVFGQDLFGHRGSPSEDGAIHSGALSYHPSKDGAAAWWVKHKHKELPRWVENLPKIEAEFQLAVDGYYDSKEWKIARQMDLKEYYEGVVVRGWQKPEYLAVINKLKELGVDVKPKEADDLV